MVNGPSLGAIWDGWADSYERYAKDVGLDEQTQMTVDFLRELSGGGPVLELGVGTGRVALPLQEAGLEMHGIDISPEMLKLLRSKPGGNRIRAILGNFQDFSLPQHFQLIYAVHSGLYALSSQEHQLGCFRSVAAHLKPGGLFVIEAFVPQFPRLLAGEWVEVRNVGPDRVVLVASRCDTAEQRVEGQDIEIDHGTVRLKPVSARYAWPSELDLMAQLAGLALLGRWAGWNRDAFNSASGRNISAYRAPDTGAIPLRPDE